MKKKILKIVLFIILFVILFALIDAIYKFVWYKKLLNAKENLINSKNYTYIVAGSSWSSNRETGEYELNYSLMGVQVKGQKHVDLNFSYADREKIVGKTYYTENEMITVNFEDKTFSMLDDLRIQVFAKDKIINYPINDIFSATGTYLTNNTISLKEKVYYIFSNLYYLFDMRIRFENEDGKDYIVLENNDWKTYFDKETLLAAKEVHEADVFSKGESYVNSYYRYELGNVTEEDLNVPDLSEYSQNVYMDS